MDFENKIPVGQHLRRCYSLNGMKSPAVEDDEDGNCSNKENVHPNRLPMVSPSERSDQIDGVLDVLCIIRQDEIG